MKSRDVVIVDAIRTAFGRAGENGYFWLTRADDMAVKVIRELMRRNPAVKPEMVEENIWGATTQEGDQGLTLGRTTAILAGLPESCSGYSVDRMCAGGLPAITAAASEIALGACDIAVAGGVEHMGHHPMGATADPNPRFLAERLVSEDALVMGKTAENLHDMYPDITKEMADEYACLSQRKTAEAYGAGKIRKMIVPMSVYTREGWAVAHQDQQPRPDTTMEALRDLKTPFRNQGRVTAGNSSGLNDGACGVLLRSEEKAGELGKRAASRQARQVQKTAGHKRAALPARPALPTFQMRATLLDTPVQLEEFGEILDPIQVAIRRVGKGPPALP